MPTKRIKDGKGEEGEGLGKKEEKVVKEKSQNLPPEQAQIQAILPPANPVNVPNNGPNTRLHPNTTEGPVIHTPKADKVLRDEVEVPLQNPEVKQSKFQQGIGPFMQDPPELENEELDNSFAAKRAEQLQGGRGTVQGAFQIPGIGVNPFGSMGSSSSNQPSMLNQPSFQPSFRSTQSEPQLDLRISDLKDPEKFQGFLNLLKSHGYSLNFHGERKPHREKRAQGNPHSRTQANSSEEESRDSMKGFESALDGEFVQTNERDVEQKMHRKGISKPKPPPAVEEIRNSEENPGAFGCALKMQDKFDKEREETQRNYWREQKKMQDKIDKEREENKGLHNENWDFTVKLERLRSENESRQQEQAFILDKERTEDSFRLEQIRQEKQREMAEIR